MLSRVLIVGYLFEQVRMYESLKVNTHIAEKPSEPLLSVGGGGLRVYNVHSEPEEAGRRTCGENSSRLNKKRGFSVA